MSDDEGTETGNNPGASTDEDDDGDSDYEPADDEVSGVYVGLEFTNVLAFINAVRVVHVVLLMQTTLSLLNSRLRLSRREVEMVSQGTRARGSLLSEETGVQQDVDTM